MDVLLYRIQEILEGFTVISLPYHLSLRYVPTIEARLIPAHFLEDFGVVVHPDRDDPVVVVGPLLVQVLYPGYVPVEMRSAGTRQHLYRAPTLPHLYGQLELFSSPDFHTQVKAP